jgi:hypothetical protein
MDNGSGGKLVDGTCGSSRSPLHWKALVEDIRTNGQVHPILVYRGPILEERHRSRFSEEAGGAILYGKHQLQACKEAGVEPKFEEVKCSPEDFARIVDGTGMHAIGGVPYPYPYAAPVVKQVNGKTYKGITIIYPEPKGG